MNKNTDPKSNPEKKRFNAADVVIILIITLIVVSLGFRIFNIISGMDKKDCNVEIVFSVENVSAEHLSLSEKEKLYNSETDEEVGYIKKFTISDMVEYAYNENGELVAAKVPGKKMITGTMVLVCDKTEKGVYLNGTHLLSVGEKLRLYTTAREMIFEISYIQEADETTSDSTSAVKR